MRIAIINKYWRPAGGVEVHALQVKKFLESRGHEVIPFAMQEDGLFDAKYESYYPAARDFREGSLPKRVSSLLRATSGRDARKALEG